MLDDAATGTCTGGRDARKVEAMGTHEGTHEGTSGDTNWLPPGAAGKALRDRALARAAGERETLARWWASPGASPAGTPRSARGRAR